MIGVDPAAASIDIARTKPSADRVRWVVGTASDAIGATDGIAIDSVDLTVMTGNVAQVFLTDDDWNSTLASIARAVVAGGHLVYEARDPAARAWEGWTTPSHRVLESGDVTVERVVTDVSLPFVSFRTSFRFAPRDVVHSESTLRFRSQAEHLASLDGAGFEVLDIRDAPDRPSLEFIFVARRRH